MQTSVANEVVEVLSSVTDVKGNLTGAGLDAHGVLTLTGDGNKSVSMTLEQFDRMYNGMVKCWPTITPLKRQVIEAQRNARLQVREAAKSAANADKEKARLAREAAKTEREVAKLAKAQDRATKAQEAAAEAQRKAAEKAAQAIASKAPAIAPASKEAPAKDKGKDPIKPEAKAAQAGKAAAAKKK